MAYDSAVLAQVSIVGVFFASGYLYTKILLDAMRSVGANGINKESIREALFSRRIMTAHGWKVGPLSDAPCGADGDSSYGSTGGNNLNNNFNGRVNDPLCECNSGGRVVSIVRITPTLQMERMPASTVKFSLDTCVQSNTVQSPLIQLVSTPTVAAATAAVVSGSSSGGGALLAAAAERAATDFVGGDRAGYINASTSPSSRSGIVAAANYGSLADLAATEADKLITVAVGGVYTEDLLPPIKGGGLVLGIYNAHSARRRPRSPHLRHQPTQLEPVSQAFALGGLSAHAKLSARRRFGRC